MYSVSFIFEPGSYDARFHELNALIDAAARATPGYVGVESWRSADGTRANAVYYWDSLEQLREFSRHPKHVEAKREYAKWYRGYHIVIAEVIRAYGDGRLSRPSMASEGPSRPSMASRALGLLPIALGILPGGLSRPSMASEALGLLPGALHADERGAGGP